MGDASSAHPPGDGAPRGCVRVVVVADHSAGMRALLRAQPASLDGVRIVGVAEDGAEAAEQPVRQVPDLMLLDNAMPTVDGLEAAAEIRRRLPEAKIVMLCGFSGENLADPARTAGRMPTWERWCRRTTRPPEFWRSRPPGSWAARYPSWCPSTTTPSGAAPKATTRRWPPACPMSP